MKYLKDYLVNHRFTKVIIKQFKHMAFIYEGLVEGIPTKYLDWFVLEHSKLNTKRRVMFIIVPDAS